MGAGRAAGTVILRAQASRERRHSGHGCGAWPAWPSPEAVAHRRGLTHEQRLGRADPPASTLDGGEVLGPVGGRRIGTSCPPPPPPGPRGGSTRLRVVVAQGRGLAHQYPSSLAKAILGRRRAGPPGQGGHLGASPTSSAAAPPRTTAGAAALGRPAPGAGPRSPSRDRPGQPRGRRAGPVGRKIVGR